jgi:hypothetical protein
MCLIAPYVRIPRKNESRGEMEAPRFQSILQEKTGSVGFGGG